MPDTPGTVIVDPQRVAKLSHLAARLPGARALSRAHARLATTSGGRLGGRWLGAPVLVLETVGRRSGQPRRTPLVYAVREGTLVVLAANAGSDRPPAWSLNLRDHGGAVVHLGSQSWPVTPRVLEGDERERAWAALAGVLPSVDGYATLTRRHLPVIALTGPIAAEAMIARTVL